MYAFISNPGATAKGKFAQSPMSIVVITDPTIVAKNTMLCPCLRRREWPD